MVFFFAATKAYLTLWKSLSFFALVENNPLNIKTDAAPGKESNQPVTLETAPKCETGTYFKNNYGSGAGGVDKNRGDLVGVSTSMWVKRKRVRFMQI